MRTGRAAQQPSRWSPPGYAPLENAALNIWHCDALGIAEFATLYPGWYSGRAIRIHMKVHLGGAAEGEKYAGGDIAHTGQLFFPEDVGCGPD